MLALGLIQSSPTEDLDGNLEKALRQVRNAARRGARIICLPELYRSRYFPQAS
ncbi:MAG: nitrilase-related carbon-nitrogen hydrolase, partial [Elusimicrobiota bacterium]